jgi:hypothetical protein
LFMRTSSSFVSKLPKHWVLICLLCLGPQCPERSLRPCQCAASALSGLQRTPMQCAQPEILEGPCRSSPRLPKLPDWLQGHIRGEKQKGTKDFSEKLQPRDEDDLPLCAEASTHLGVAPLNQLGPFLRANTVQVLRKWISMFIGLHPLRQTTCLIKATAVYKAWKSLSNWQFTWLNLT